MLSFMSDRRVLAVSAAFITAAIFLFLLGTFPSWKQAVGHGISWPSETAGVPAPASKPDKAAALSPAPAETPAAHISAEPARTLTAAAPTSAAAPAPVPPVTAVAEPNGAATKPSFDIVRVEPTGESVVAARAKPGATVILLDQGRVIARAQADTNGQVAFVPPSLGPGDHSFMLSVGEPDQPGSLSSQSVAVSVPDRAKTAPLVALLQPDQPTKVLSGPTTPVPHTAGAQAAPTVSVGAIDVEEMGSVFATGQATPGSQCRVYLNGSFVAGVTAGPDGTWSLKIEHGMRPGHYSVRVDELASAAGDVKARAEVPFDYPARTAGAMSLLRPRKGQTALKVPAGGAAAPLPGPAVAHAEQPASLAVQGDALAAKPAQVATAAPSADAAPVPPTVVSQLLTTKVMHGDSLWRISRKMLGHGRRYTQIYAANTSQIRDPKLIYPGQIFVMPQAGP